MEEMTTFLNPVYNSYERLGADKAPKYIGWGRQNRTQLIRVPAVCGSEEKRFEVRSPDPMIIHYIGNSLIFLSGLDGIKNNMLMPSPEDVNLYTAPLEITSKLKKLPETLSSAIDKAKDSDFIKQSLPESLINCLTSSF